MLAKPEKEVADFVGRMEDKLCYPNHDIRLVDEVNQAVKQKVASLGLDPHDTTGQELYHSLQAKFASDTKLTDKALGIAPEDGFEARLSRAIEIAKHVVGEVEVWALKPTKARSVLQDLPPKKVMKQFGYRSLDSMLKRENVGELYLMAPYVESHAWQVNFAKAIVRLSSSDYGLQAINFVQPTAGKWDSLPEPPDLNICNKQTGSLTIWPNKSTPSAPVISLSLVLLRSVAQLGINYDVQSLAAVHPSLHWWTSMNHLISLHEEGPVSLNIHDVAHNHLNSLSHQDSAAYHGAQALWGELANRYNDVSGGIGQAVEDELSNLMPAQLAAEYEKV